MKITLYAVANDCGDGSVSINLFTSKEMAEWRDRNNAGEGDGQGFAEPSIKTFDIEISDYGKVIKGTDDFNKYTMEDFKAYKEDADE